ncbi:MAG TPA: hypothetical protein VMJ12_08625 [Candidatus Acidoferrales bacterium]|nr:hypothetical protein [Candidatus Acidoferrales bacterium]
MAEQPDNMGGEDLYDSAPTGAKGSDKPNGDEDEKSDSEEAILPKSILAGKEFKVGDEVVLKITGIHDDQISVKYAPVKADDEGEGEEGGGEMTPDEADMPAGMGSGDANYD